MKGEEDMLNAALLIRPNKAAFGSRCNVKRKPSLIHVRLSLRVFQGHPGRINHKSNLSRYMSPFDVSCKNTAYFVLPIRENTVNRYLLHEL